MAEQNDPGGRPAKSAAAFRTISEVASELDVPQHVLRFWESKFAQVRPMKRGGGRRYYRPEDVDLLRSIRDLLYDDGYTIKGVQKLLKERGAKSLVRDLGEDGVAARTPPAMPPTGNNTGRPGDVAEPASADAAETAEPAADRATLVALLDDLKQIRELVEDGRSAG